MAGFKSLLAVAFALIATASAASQLESRQVLGPLQWNNMGCWSDDPAARTLKMATFTDATAMSVDKCQTFCNTGNFTLAGVEFAKECWCSNAMDNGPRIIASSECSQACTGSSLEKCGGPGALGVYRLVI